MATFTSTRAGNWSSASVWGGTGPPGAGDLAIIAVVQSAVSAAANNGSGLIRLTVGSTGNWTTGQYAYVAGVTGTTEANGLWVVTVVDGTHLDLQSSTFTHAYVSGGNANCVVAVDTNTTVGATTFVGIGIAINGTNATQFGALIVLSGVTLTLCGFDLTTHCMMQINQYGHFEPQPGSTVLGNVAANFGSKIVNKGRLRALGSGGSPITFSIPAANVPSWATASGTEAHSLSGFLKYTYDAQNNIGIFKLTHNWVSNASGTGPGSSGSSSLSFNTLTGDTGMLATEVASLSLVNGTGKYYVNYDRGTVYFYHVYSATALTFNAVYTYLVDSTAWRGWGIDTSTGLTGNSLELDHCTFQYMGDQSTNPTLLCKSLTGGQSDASTLLQITNCTVTNCYRFGSFTSCSGDATHQIQIANNTFNDCRGDATTFWCLGFPASSGSPTGSSYMQLNGNTLNQKNYFLSTNNTSGRTTAHSHINIDNNTGNIGGFLITNAPDLCTWADCTMHGNAIAFQGQIFPNNTYQLEHFGGTSGHPAVISGNAFGFMAVICVNSYLTIDSNFFYKSYAEIAPCQVVNTARSNLTVTNNLFYDGYASNADVFGQTMTVSTGAAIDLFWNFPVWWDNVVIANNTFLGYNNGFIVLNGSFDAGQASALTGLEVKNNLHYAGATNFASRSIWKMGRVTGTLGTSGNKCPVAVKELDYNLSYNSGAMYQINLPGGDQANVSGGTFMMSGSKYNFNGSRNVTGVTLSQPGYSSAQGSGRSLVYTINSAGSDETLAWGGGTAVQMVQSHGTATAATNTTNGTFGAIWSGTLSDTTLSQWSTTADSASCPGGCWIKITGGTGSGQIRMIVNVTSTSQVVTVPGWTVIPDATSVYSIYHVERTLIDSAATTSGIMITTTGTGYTSAPTATWTGGGSATPVLGGLSGGQVVGFTAITPGTSNVAGNTVTFSGGGGSGAAAKTLLGSVQAGIDIRSLPGSSQTDSGITLVFNDVTSDPLLSNVGALPTLWYSLPNLTTDAANAKFTAGSSAKDTGSADTAPSLDFFGSARPQGSAIDIGFFEMLASAGALIRRITTGGD